jgi:5'-phosphate synthase pdxT subunit
MPGGCVLLDLQRVVGSGFPVPRRPESLASPLARRLSLGGVSSPPSTAPRVGVLAVQGDVREHLRVLEAVGARPSTVRRTTELDEVDAVVIPGGESTTMDKLVRAFDLYDPLKARIKDGMPVYGSCAGMIMLADQIADGPPDQQTLGGLDITVRRNAFGRQVDSFEEDIHFAGLDGLVRAVFIRAPWVEETGEAVEVLARVEDGPAAGRIVAVRQGDLLATSFHPEVTGDHRVHALFVRMCTSGS